jgi:hypothetical protein
VRHPAATPSGFLRLPPVVTTVINMASLPTIPSPPAGVFSGFRLVVQARTSGHKGYVWEIIHEEHHPHVLVGRSSGSYRSMEEAYADGSVALARVRARGAPASTA